MTTPEYAILSGYRQDILSILENVNELAGTALEDLDMNPEELHTLTLTVEYLAGRIRSLNTLVSLSRKRRMREVARAA